MSIKGKKIISRNEFNKIMKPNYHTNQCQMSKLRKENILRKKSNLIRLNIWSS